MANWIVQGTDIETGEAQTVVIEGMSKAHAEVLALKRGMRVESVEPDQLCPGDDSRLGAINFVDPTEPIEKSGPELEIAEPGFQLPAWFTCRRCKQLKTLGIFLIVAGLIAFFAHNQHEGYAFAVTLGALLVIGAWAARKFNMIRLTPIPQHA
ncbi:MAG: hypothetical protein ACTS27_06610 [Phycisphaerales bacterium]